MSFSGVTFSNQQSTPSDDALLMQSLLSDGRIVGCGLDFAGFTLSMAPGQMIAAGRNIRHPASESWAVSGGTSGFARLVLTIDLSKTATMETFEQIETFIDYASTSDGFPVLERSEINVSGVKYQVELCVVALSTGGITEIVRQMPFASIRFSSLLLQKVLAAGPMVLSSHQIVEELPPLEDVPEGAFLGLVVGEV